MLPKFPRRRLMLVVLLLAHALPSCFAARTSGEALALRQRFRQKYPPTDEQARRVRTIFHGRTHLKLRESEQHFQRALEASDKLHAMTREAWKEHIHSFPEQAHDEDYHYHFAGFPKPDMPAHERITDQNAVAERHVQKMVSCASEAFATLPLSEPRCMAKAKESMPTGDAEVGRRPGLLAFRPRRLRIAKVTSGRPARALPPRSLPPRRLPPSSPQMTQETDSAPERADRLAREWHGRRAKDHLDRVDEIYRTRVQPQFAKQQQAAAVLRSRVEDESRFRTARGAPLLGQEQEAHEATLRRQAAEATRDQLNESVAAHVQRARVHAFASHCHGRASGRSSDDAASPIAAVLTDSCLTVHGTRPVRLAPGSKWHIWYSLQHDPPPTD